MTFYIIYDIILLRYRPAYISKRGCTLIFKIELYSTEDGKEVLAEFINELPAKHQAKAFREIDLLAEFGNALKEPYVKHIKHQLDEDQIADQMSLKEFIDPFTGSKNTKA